MVGDVQEVHDVRHTQAAFPPVDEPPGLDDPAPRRRKVIYAVIVAAVVLAVALPVTLIFALDR